MVASTMQSDRAVNWQCVGFLVLANGCYQSAGTCNDVLANGWYQLAVARSRTWANNNLLANGCYQLAVTCRNVLEYGCHHGWLLATLLWQIVNLRLLFCRMLAIRDYPVEPSPLLGLECTLHFQLTLGLVIANGWYHPAVYLLPFIGKGVLLNRSVSVAYISKTQCTNGC